MARLIQAITGDFENLVILNVEQLRYAIFNDQGVANVEQVVCYFDNQRIVVIKIGGESARVWNLLQTLAA